VERGLGRVVELSVLWKEKKASKVFTYQGLTTCTEVDRSWTILSSTYNHLRKKRGENERGMEILIREEWSTACRQRNSPVLGNEQGPTVFLWDGLGEEGREECERVIQSRKYWIVWSRARPMKGDCTPRGFEHVGKTVFCGKAKRSKKEQGEPEAEEGMEDKAPKSEVNVSGRARRQRGWWKRGVMETKLNTVNMTAWVHKECDIMDQDPTPFVRRRRKRSGAPAGKLASTAGSLLCLSLSLSVAPVPAPVIEYHS